MALTETEEALLRELLDEKPELDSLSDNASAILAKLSGTKVGIADLTAALQVNGTDLMLIVQDGTAKNATAGMLYSALGTYGHARIFGSWTAASAASFSAGDAAIVFGDAGTHTDPVVGGTVPNEGIFIYSASPAGLEWVAPVLTTQLTDAVDAAQASADAAETAADLAELSLTAITTAVPGVFFDNTTDGLAGTLDEQWFATWEDARQRIYLNDAGTAVPKTENATAALIDLTYSKKADLASNDTGKGASLIGADTGGTVEDAIWHKGRATPIAASKAQVQWVRDQPGATFPPEDMGGLWTDKVHYAHAVNAEFDATNAPVTTPLSSPAVTLLLASHNTGSDAIVVPVQCISGVHANSKEAANANFITYCDAGVTNVKMKGPEIDIQPGAGATISEAFGLAINAFTMSIPGPAIYIEGIFGGKWGTGIQVGELDTNGAALSPAPGTPTMATLINTGDATYTDAAIRLSNTHRIKINGSSGNPGFIYADASNFLRVVPTAAGIVIRKNDDTGTLVSIDPSGNVALENGGTVAFTAALSSTSATAGSQTLPANPVGFLTVKIDGANRKIPYYAS